MLFTAGIIIRVELFSCDFVEWHCLSMHSVMAANYRWFGLIALAPIENVIRKISTQNTNLNLARKSRIVRTQSTRFVINDERHTVDGRLMCIQVLEVNGFFLTTVSRLTDITTKCRVCLEYTLKERMLGAFLFELLSLVNKCICTCNLFEYVCWTL